MKLISWNVNGIRAVERKGELQNLLEKEEPDLLFLQETKAKKEQLSDYLTAHSEYFQFYHSAEKPGYSGVSVWVRRSLSVDAPEVFTGMPGWNDHEGRVIGVELAGAVCFGVYFPNGGKSHEAWLEKLKFYDHFLDYCNDLKSKGKRVIWGGDLNVAHNEIDLARPKENDGNIGFHPDERAWVDRVIGAGWSDVFRSLYSEKISYTWWNVVTRARQRNVGWRIDYFFMDEKDLPHVTGTSHLGEQMGSDHCPIVLELDLSL